MRKANTIILSIVALFTMNVLQPVSVFAQQALFREDFDDADFPVSWYDAGDPGNRSVVGGNYLLRHTAAGAGQMFAGVGDGLPADQSVRMQARALEDSQGDWTYFGVFGRNLDGLETYYGGVGTDGDLFIGRATDTNVVIVDQVSAQLDTRAWINIELNIVGDDIRLRGWEEGTDRPAEPQLAIVDSLFTSGDGAGFNYNLRGATNLPTLEVNYFEVVSVPEPSTAAFFAIVLVVRFGCRL